MRFLLKLFPADWQESVIAFQKMHAVSRRDLFYTGILAILTNLTEAMGLFLIWPILQYAEKGGDVTALIDTSALWVWIVKVFEFFDVPISLLALSATAFTMIMSRQIISYTNTMFLARLRENLSKRMRMEAFDTVFLARGEFIQDLGSGAFVQMMQTLAPSAAIVMQNIISTSSVIFALVIYSAGLVLISPAATAAVIVIGFALGRWLRYYRIISRSTSDRLVHQLENFVQFVSERYHGWRLIKLTGNLDKDKGMVKDHVDYIADLNIEVTRAGEKIQVFITPIAAFFALVGLYVALEFMGMAVADIMVFVIVLFRLTPLVQSSLSARQRLAASMAFFSRLRYLIAKAHENLEPYDGSKAYTGITDSIVFENLTYSYRNAEFPALKDINLTIPAGKMTAVIGPSGAGKSTLADLIPRIVTPEQGRILIDGVDVSEFALKSLRQGIAFVSQHPVLFKGTVRENLLYARGGATEDEMDEACRKAFAYDFITGMPDGYDTIIGEGGQTLSGGQRQRLVLARAFLSHAKLLILDEPTSALDYESEQYVQRAIEAAVASGEMTVLIIAHRMSTIRNADHIIVLDRGELLEQGDPHELRHSSAWFKRMIDGDNVMAE
jgi:subfamily B ATP-binding cassette protein MsbA